MHERTADLTIGILGAAYLISRIHQEVRAQTWGENFTMFVAKAALSVLAVAACFALPASENEIRLTWLLGVSALFVPAGATFLFGPILTPILRMVEPVFAPEGAAD